MIIEKLATLAVLTSVKTQTVLALLASGISLKIAKPHHSRLMRAPLPLVQRLHDTGPIVTIPATPLSRDDQWQRLCETATLPTHVLASIAAQQRDAEIAIHEATLFLQSLHGELATLPRLPTGA